MCHGSGAVSILLYTQLHPISDAWKCLAAVAEPLERTCSKNPRIKLIDRRFESVLTCSKLRAWPCRVGGLEATALPDSCLVRAAELMYIDEAQSRAHRHKRRSCLPMAALWPCLLSCGQQTVVSIGRAVISAASLLLGVSG